MGGQGGADQLGQLGLVARVSARSPWPCLVSTSRMNRLSKISVKYAKISQSIRQISLNFSQNFAPPDDAAVDVVGLVVNCVHERGHDGGRLLGGDDVEVEREDLVALCNGDAFGVSETTERRSRKHHYTRGSSWPFRARRTAPAPGERSARGTPA